MSNLIIVALLFSLNIVAKPDPLIGSLWAKKHPNQLPYTNCELTLKESHAGLIKSYSKVSGRRHRTLHCISRPLKGAPNGLEFIIPLGDFEIKTTGFTAILGLNVLSARVHGLHGKSVSELYNTFKGRTVVGGFLHYALVYKKYGTENEIRFHVEDRCLALGLEVGKSTLSINRRDVIKRKACLNNSYIIDASTAKERDEEYCNDFIVDANNPEKLFFDSSKIDDLQFVYKAG